MKKQVKKAFSSFLTLAITLLLITFAPITASAASYPYEAVIVKELTFLSDKIYRCNIGANYHVPENYFVAETNWTTEQFFAWYYDMDGNEIFPSASKQLQISGDLAVTSTSIVINRIGKTLFEADMAKGADTSILFRSDPYSGAVNSGFNAIKNGYLILKSKDQKKTAVMNNKGEIIVPYGKYKSIDYYDGDTAIVKNKDEWRVINVKTGKVIKSLKDYIIESDEGPYAGKHYDNGHMFQAFYSLGKISAWDKIKNKNVALDKNGEEIFESETWIREVDGDYAIVNGTNDDGVMLINKDGKIIIPPGKYYNMNFCGDGMILINYEESYPPTLINTKG